MRKKFLAFFLAASMVIQPMGGAVYAAEAGTVLVQEEENAEAAQMEQGETKPEEKAEAVLTEAEPGNVSAPAEEEESSVPSAAETAVETEQTGTEETKTAESTSEETVSEAESTEEETESEGEAETESGNETETSGENGTEIEAETEFGTESAGEAETETETQTETEIETETGSTEELPVYESLDESMSKYLWQELTMTAGSSQVLLDYYTEAYPGTTYLFYATDEAKEFWPEQVYIDRDEHLSLSGNGYQEMSFGANYKYENGKYHVIQCLTGFEPETTYYFRAARSSWDSASQSSKYFFLTEKSSFTTGAELEESRVSLTDLQLVETGYAAAKISFTLNNPELEKISSLTIVDEADNTLATLSSGEYNAGTKVSLERSFALMDVSAVTQVKVRAKVSTAGESTWIDSEDIRVSLKDREGFSPQAVCNVGGRNARFNITVDDWYNVDSGSIRAVLSYRKADAEELSQKTGYVYENCSISLENLEENTEYIWSIRYETVKGQQLFEDEGGRFIIGEEITYTDDDFPDETLREAIRSRIGSGKPLTNTILAAVTSLYIYESAGTPVRNLEGIQYLPNLQTLNISNHELTSAEQVEQLKELTSLSLYSNNLTSMPDLSGNTKLEYINLNYNLLPESEITQDKLPEAFLQKNPGWIINTVNSQRRPFSTRTAQEYYATGNTWPFIVAVSGIKKTQNYTLLVSVDGDIWSGIGYLYTSSEEELIVVKGMSIDTSSGETKEVTYSLIGADDVVYENEKTVTCKFVADAAGRMNYAKSTDARIPVEVKMAGEELEALGEITGMEITGSGETLGTSNDVYTFSQGNDSRYETVFGDSWIDTGYEIWRVGATVTLTKYLKAGQYDLKVIGADGDRTFEKALTVTGGCVVEEAYIYDEVDSSGDYVYIQLGGCNIDPEKIHPEITGKNGEKILEYVGVAKLPSRYSEDAVIYKYRKTGNAWGKVNSVAAVWSLQAQPGYEYLDTATSHSLTFWDEDPILMVHYNYKKGMLETKLAASVPEGTEVQITLADGHDLDRDNTVIYGSGSGKVVKNWVSVNLLDVNGEEYVPVRDALMYVHVVCSGDGEGKWYSYQQISWYNYSSSSAVTQKWISAVPVRTEDKSVSVTVGTGLEEGTPAILRLYEGGTVVLEQDVTVGKNGRIERKLDLPKALSAGEHTLQLMVDNAAYVASKLIVYDKDLFYMDYQYGSVNDGTLTVYFDSDQVYGENSRSGGIDFYKANDYLVTLYDRAGKEIKSMKPSSVTKRGTSLYYVNMTVTDVPTDGYTGFYVKISRNGQLGRMISDPSKTYYESGNYNCHPEYGVWINTAGVSDDIYFMVDDGVSHGYFGIAGDNAASYPVTVVVYEQSTDNILKQFKVNNAGSYYFSDEDLSGLDEETVYDIVAVAKSGLVEAFQTGYLVCKQEPVAVSGIKLNKTKLLLTLDEGGNKEELTVTYTPSNANTGKTITWTSSNTAVATVTDGFVSAVGAGTADITATTANGRQAVCKVQVVDYSLSKSELAMNVGDKEQLQVTDGTNVLKAVWSSSNTAVVTVSAAGEVEAVGKGNAVITAKLSDELELTCQVTVNSELKSITFQKMEETLEVGDSDFLTVIYVPADEAENCEMKWISSNQEVAQVDGGVVTALREGIAEITAVAVTPVTGRTLEAKCIYEVKTPDVAQPVPEAFYVYAVTNLDATLASVAEQLPEKWQWAAPDTALAQFAGMLEKDFAVKHVNGNTGEVTYSTVTVRFSTIKNLRLENIPAKLATGEGKVSVSASYDVVGEPLKDREKAPKLTWSFELASKAKAGIIELTEKDEEAGTVSISALKAGSTNILAVLKAGERQIASVTQKITTVDSSKTGLADVSVQLTDVNGENIPQENGIYTVQSGSTVYLKDDTPVNESNGKAFKVTYKSSDAGIAKTGKVDAADKTRTQLVTGKAGLAVITATANDAVKSEQRLAVMVEDRTEKGIDISTASVSFNTALADPAAEVYIYNGFGATLTDAKIEQSEICSVASFEGNGAIRLVPGSSAKKGSVKLSVTVEKDGTTVSKSFTLKVSVSKKTPAVTVKQLKKVNTFYKDSWGLLSVGAAGEAVTDVKIKEDGFGYSYSYDTGMLEVCAADKIANKKCTLQIWVQGYGQPVEKKITIGTETNTLALSTTSGTVYGDGLMTMKTQIVDKKTKAPVSLEGVVITLSNKENYAVETLGDVLLITAVTAPAKTEKLTLKVENPGNWNESRTFTFTVKSAASSKATLQLGTKTMTLYDYGMTVEGRSNRVSTGLTLNGANTANELLEKVQITAADKKSQGVLNQTLVLGYDAGTGMLSAALNGEGPAGGTYKYNLTLQDSVFAKPLKTTVSIKVVKVADMSKCVKVTAKGSIDVLNRDGTNVVVTPKFTNIAADAKVSSISLTGRDAHLFEIADINGSAATLQLKDSAHVITKYKYEVKLAYVIETGSAAYTIESAPVGIKLAQGKVKAAAAGANTFSAAVSEGKSLNFTVTNSMGEQVEISDVKLVNFSKDFAYDFETGVLKHQLNGETARGKSYTLKFELYLADRGDNEKPVTVTWKVQIVK